MSEDKQKRNFEWGIGSYPLYVFEMGRDLLTGNNRTGENFKKVPYDFDADIIRDGFNKIKDIGEAGVDRVSDALENRSIIAKGITKQDVLEMRTINDALIQRIEDMGENERKRFDKTNFIVKTALWSNYPLSHSDASEPGAGFNKITEILLKEENLGDAFDAFKNDGSKHLFFAETYFKQLGQDASDKGILGTFGSIIGGFAKAAIGAFTFVSDWLTEGLKKAKENFQNNILEPSETFTKDVLKRDITERLENIRNDLIAGNDLIAEGFSETKADAIITVMKKEINRALAHDKNVPKTFKDGLFSEAEIQANSPNSEELLEPLPEQQQGNTQTNKTVSQGQDISLGEELSALPTPSNIDNTVELTPSELSAANRGY